jgi:hypothetical protein
VYCTGPCPRCRPVPPTALGFHDPGVVRAAIIGSGHRPSDLARSSAERCRPDGSGRAAANVGRQRGPTSWMPLNSATRSTMSTPYCSAAACRSPLEEGVRLARLVGAGQGERKPGAFPLLLVVRAAAEERVSTSTLDPITYSGKSSAPSLPLVREEGGGSPVKITVVTPASLSLAISVRSYAPWPGRAGMGGPRRLDPTSVSDFFSWANEAICWPSIVS